MSAAALNAFHTVYLHYSLQRASVVDVYTLHVNIHPLPRTDDGEVRSVIQNIKHSIRTVRLQQLTLIKQSNIFRLTIFR